MGGVTLPPVPVLRPGAVPPLAAPFFLAGMTSSRRYFWRPPVFLELSTPSQKTTLFGWGQRRANDCTLPVGFACARPACERCGSPESKSSKGVASKIEHVMCRKFIYSERNALKTRDGRSTPEVHFQAQRWYCSKALLLPAFVACSSLCLRLNFEAINAISMQFSSSSGRGKTHRRRPEQQHIHFPAHLVAWVSLTDLISSRLLLSACPVTWFPQLPLGYLPLCFFLVGLSFS